MSGAAYDTISVERGEAFNQLGLQGGACLRLHVLQRPLLSLGFSVGAIGRKSVEDVDHRDDPGAEGDLLALQAIGYTCWCFSESFLGSVPRPLAKILEEVLDDDVAAFCCGTLSGSERQDTLVAGCEVPRRMNSGPPIYIPREEFLA